MKKSFLLLSFLFIGNLLLVAQTKDFATTYQHYFALKDALVKSDPQTTAKAATSLTKELETILSDKSGAADPAMQKQLAACLEDAQHISETNEISHQRDHFMSLSTMMFAIMKTKKPQEPVYYQFCPMANKGKGANWISQQALVQNPYYGAKMLTCGRVAETLK